MLLFLPRFGGTRTSVGSLCMGVTSIRGAAYFGKPLSRVRQEITYAAVLSRRHLEEQRSDGAERLGAIATGNSAFPDARRRDRAHPGPALAPAWRLGGGTPAGHEPSSKMLDRRIIYIAGIAFIGSVAMDRMMDRAEHLVAAYLQKPVSGYEPTAAAEPTGLRNAIKLGDVLLIEGHSRISGIIKYLTQSTWSHAALYVGEIPSGRTAGGESCELVESNIDAGVIAAPLSGYLRFRTRICRPVGLTESDCRKVCDFAIARIGCQYDLKNLIDLARYLVPLPVPQRWRRRMIALGSGDPTRLICSTLIAQAFQSVGYPILPSVDHAGSEQARREIFHIRDSTLYAPRDFDISPYFAVIKPTIEAGFDYRKIEWFEVKLTGRPMQTSR
jgi:hypothetical protein